MKKVKRQVTKVLNDYKTVAAVAQEMLRTVLYKDEDSYNDPTWRLQSLGSFSG